MGRPGGMSKRVKARATAAADGALRETEEDRMARKDEAELFYVDTDGSKKRRRRIAKETAQVQSGGASATEREILRKMRLKNGPKVAGKSKRKASSAQDYLYDPWGEEGEEAVGATLEKKAAKAKQEIGLAKGKKRVAVRPCAPGQSYNPSFADHEDILEKAAALEVRRVQAAEDAVRPLNAGMSEATTALLLGDESGSESDSGGEGEDADVGVDDLKRNQKLTKTQRNKQKRRRAAEREVRMRLDAKATRREMERMSAIVKEVDMDEELRAAKREHKLKLMKQSEEEDDGTLKLPNNHLKLAAVPSIPVSLPDELQGSLRQVKSQGSALLDRVRALADEDLHPVVSNPDQEKRKNKRRGPKSHRIIPQYKK